MHILLPLYSPCSPTLGERASSKISEALGARGILAQAWLGCKDSNQQEMLSIMHFYLQGCLLYNA